MSEITVVGLGPGRPGLVTREAWDVLCGAGRLLLRTALHPTVDALRERGISFASYDSFYEEAGDFSSLYQRIAEDLVDRAGKGERIVYAVPGSPFVAERTVVLLRKLAEGSGIPLSVLPGMSFVEVLYGRLGVDPIDGVAILDAGDLDQIAKCGSLSMVLTQLYDLRVASDAKLLLLEMFPDEHEVLYLHHLSLPEESVRRIPLFEMDRQKDLDYLTSLFVPKL